VIGVTAMNCDEFLAAQETGGALARWRARRHAAHCPRCAALAAKFAAAKELLAGPEPLSPRARWLWKQAAEEPAGRPAVSLNRSFFAFLLAAAACVALLVILPKLTGHQPGGPIKSPTPIVEVPKPPAERPTVVVIDPKQELAQLSEAVDRLDEEIKQLRLDAQRADARRQVAMAFDRYDKW
jgi:hypothetical protein